MKDTAVLQDVITARNLDFKKKPIMCQRQYGHVKRHRDLESGDSGGGEDQRIWRPTLTQADLAHFTELTLWIFINEVEYEMELKAE